MTGDLRREGIDRQLLLADPTQGAQHPSSQCREMSLLATEQARIFLRAASLSRQACVFAVTGMGPSEYLGLCCWDIDWDLGTVSIEPLTSMTRNGSLLIQSGSESSNCQAATRVLELLRKFRSRTDEDVGLSFSIR